MKYVLGILLVVTVGCTSTQRADIDRGLRLPHTSNPQATIGCRRVKTTYVAGRGFAEFGELVKDGDEANFLVFTPPPPEPFELYDCHGR
jgi:hypothetical protein